MVLFFSGTGNTQYIADRIAKNTNSDLYSMNMGIKQDTYPAIDDDTVVFVVPTCAWRIPRIVEEWIRNGAVFSRKKAYFVLTCGDSIGNAGTHAKKLCADLDMQFMGCAPILMPENYIALFNCPSVEQSKQIVRAAQPKADKLAALIQSKEPFPAYHASLLETMSSNLINEAFYWFIAGSKKFKVSEACIGCAKCAKLCPTNSIHMQDGHPVWGRGCTHCMSCICHCPAGAIEYGKATRGRRRYLCPIDA